MVSCGKREAKIQDKHRRSGNCGATWSAHTYSALRHRKEGKSMQKVVSPA
jgi:hypothetical protein